MQRIVLRSKLLDSLDWHYTPEVPLVSDDHYLRVRSCLLDLLDPVVLQLLEGVELVDRVG